MTLRLYADRKGWPLEGVEIALRHDRERVIDPAGNETLRDRVIERVELRGPLDAAQRARLLEIGSRCPVRRTLAHGLAISEELVATPRDE